jgi:hypothetical protein
MGLGPEDKLPEGITLAKAYRAIRTWYQTHTDLIRGSTEEYRARSKKLIDALPPANKLDELELRAVLLEVIMGLLEWGYHDSDGAYKMGAYAHAALDAAELGYRLSEQERRQLSTSVLAPFLSLTKL